MPFAAAAHPKANSCVIACSREAKILGLKNVMSIAEAKAACPDLLLVPQKPDLYRRAHNTLLSEISTVIPIDAVKSIDEMTCRLEPMTRTDPLAVGRKIKARIRNHVTPVIFINRPHWQVGLECYCIKGLLYAFFEAVEFLCGRGHKMHHLKEGYSERS